MTLVALAAAATVKRERIEAFILNNLRGGEKWVWRKIQKIELLKSL
jgi:hypothetical protein